MKAKRILCTALASVFAFGLAACTQQGGGGSTSPVGTVSEPEEHKVATSLHQINVGTTDTDMIVRGETDYTVVYPEGADGYVTEAAGLVRRHFATAASATVNAATDAGLTFSNAEKWIVIGSEKLFGEAGLTMPEQDIGDTGYYIRTVGNSVFIAANTSYGLQNGTLEFLHHAIGYEMYAADTVVYTVTGDDVVKLPDFDIIDRPDFEYFLPSNRLSSTGATGMRFFDTVEVFVPVNGQTWHNSFEYLDPNDYPDNPEWFSDDKTQLCYTAHGDADDLKAMIDELMVTLIASVEAYPNVNNITITIQDNQNACRCDACTAEYEKYGTDSAVVVKFCNLVAERLDEYFAGQAEKTGTQPRQMNILFFAYNKMFQPPVKKVNGRFEPIDESVVCRDNVGVYIAPIDAAYNASFYDEVNRTTADAIEGWGVCSSKLYMWLYETNYSYYLYPLNSYDSMLETYRFCVNNNAIFMFPEGQYNQGSVTAFGRLKEYFNSKALWNVNIDYSDLLDDFFANYFRDAAEPMRRYFDELQTQLRYIENTYPEINGGIYNNIAQARFWPKRMLDQWLEYMDEAYAAVEHYRTSDPALYETLRNHILLETIFPRFALVTLHTGYYSDATLKSMRDAFREDCSTLSITMYSEVTTLESIFSGWN